MSRERTWASLGAAVGSSTWREYKEFQVRGEMEMDARVPAGPEKGLIMAGVCRLSTLCNFLAS